MESTRRYNQRAPNLYELLHGLWAATPKVTMLPSCYVDLIGDLFTKHQRNNFLPDLMSLYFSLPGVKRHLYYITRAFGFTESTILRWASIQGSHRQSEKTSWKIVYGIRLEGRLQTCVWGSSWSRSFCNLPIAFGSSSKCQGAVHLLLVIDTPAKHLILGGEPLKGSWSIEPLAHDRRTDEASYCNHNIC